MYVPKHEPCTQAGTPVERRTTYRGRETCHYIDCDEHEVFDSIHFCTGVCVGGDYAQPADSEFCD